MQSTDHMPLIDENDLFIPLSENEQGSIQGGCPPCAAVAAGAAVVGTAAAVVGATVAVMEYRQKYPRLVEGRGSYGGPDLHLGGSLGRRAI
jgi:hypothetical protein